MPQTKKQAEELGRELLAKIKGHGWKLRVHENLGWHYNVEMEIAGRGGVVVYEHFYNAEVRYSCLMSSTSCGSGDGEWTTKVFSGDPNEIVKWQLKVAQNIINSKQDFLTRVAENLDSE